ncbi:uncharacterized protein LOC134836964 [Culicoides brevitarsis]|uniref:uncharacterized protein LOC134836964 n=1 Tax=Culicoides brevitarsis TaxID=469753 RepID=UPI00307C3ED5
MLIFRTLRARNKVLWKYGKLLLESHRMSSTYNIVLYRELYHQNSDYDLRRPIAKLLQGLGIDTGLKLESINKNQIDGLLLEAMINEDRDAIFYILQEAHKNHLISKPSQYCLEKIMITYIKDRPLLKIFFNSRQDWMEPYFVANNWYLGNFQLAGQQFRELFFAGDEKQKMRIHFLLNKITLETVGYKSEAQLVVLASLAEYFVCIFDCYRLLFHVWRIAFKSTWYSDQCLAKELYKNYPGLRIHLQDIVVVAKYFKWLLKIDELDAAHRLVQLFLEYEERDLSRLCVSLLFEYHFLRKDLGACSEIMKFCIKSDLHLSDMHEGQLLDLLLGTDERPVMKQKEIQKTKEPKLKF